MILLFKQKKCLDSFFVLIFISKFGEMQVYAVCCMLYALFKIKKNLQYYSAYFSCLSLFFPIFFFLNNRTRTTMTMFFVKLMNNREQFIFKLLQNSIIKAQPKTHRERDTYSYGKWHEETRQTVSRYMTFYVKRIEIYTCVFSKEKKIICVSHLTFCMVND